LPATSAFDLAAPDRSAYPPPRRNGRIDETWRNRIATAWNLSHDPNRRPNRCVTHVRGNASRNDEAKLACGTAATFDRFVPFDKLHRTVTTHYETEIVHQSRESVDEYGQQELSRLPVERT
jgi:hypothetical protein